jgi:transcriptional regulator with XRE-family HTH domain
MTQNEKMRFYREAMGWSRIKYAEMSGFNENYVLMVEKGRRAVSKPYSEKMERVLLEHPVELTERAAALLEVLRPTEKVS